MTYVCRSAGDYTAIMWYPASTGMTAPVMPLDNPLHRNRAVWATSSTVMLRFKGRSLCVGVAHIPETADAPRRQRLQGAGGYGIDADVGRPHFSRQLTNRVLQGCLGRTHYVVARIYPLRGVEGHGNHAAAVPHQRGSVPHQGKQVNKR